MVPGQSCLIAVIGLQEHEIRLIKSILRHSNDRHHGRYDWADELSHAHVILVNADNEDAMTTWQTYSRGQNSPIWVLITSQDVSIESEYFFSRPLAPTKLMGVLDKLYHEKLETVLEEKVFAGSGNAIELDSALASSSADKKIRRALVVDDSPTVRKQLNMELGSFDIRVDMAETGEQCLDLVSKSVYDIIFLDVILPGADGYEICKKIKKNQGTKDIPVVMLTSKSSSFDRVRGAMAGCNSYLTKPVDYEKFHKVLEDYLIQDD